ncbi:hypothetical protein FA15DRAFT_653759 [Coprinopsis marcescibilis]|uniref:Uncharacterized protein n=1 Tax=Coprinopsis marcescibilis TaxID=230819 RepID=A0A5C3L392_COPMA|nr:hypothetical protein FA15DRAFT_653759 [Coprinopsis marcescibilis]
MCTNQKAIIAFDSCTKNPQHDEDAEHFVLCQNASSSDRNGVMVTEGTCNNVVDIPGVPIISNNLRCRVCFPDATFEHTLKGLGVASGRPNGFIKFIKKTIGY